MIVRILLAMLIFFIGLCWGYIRYNIINKKISNFIMKIMLRKFDKMVNKDLEELDKIFNSNK